MRLDPGAGALMNLADCEEHIGNVASAWEHWREALDSLQGKSDKRAALARRKIAALDRRLPRLTLRLEAGAPDGVTLERDGVTLGSSALGLPVPVDPGLHSVVVHAPKHADRSYSLTIKEAQLVEQSVGAGPESRDHGPTGGVAMTPDGEGKRSVAVAPSSSASSGKATAHTLGYVFIGVGGGRASASVRSPGLVALGKKNTVEQHCQADSTGGVGCTDQTGLDAASSGRSMATLSTIGVCGRSRVDGGRRRLLVATGKDGAATTTAIAPRVLPGGMGLSLARTF